MTPTTDGRLPALISMTAAGERLACSRSTIYRYLARGLLVAHRDPVSMRVGIEVAGVEALAARRVVLGA